MTSKAKKFTVTHKILTAHLTWSEIAVKCGRMLSLESQRAFQNFLGFLLRQVTNHLRLVFTSDGVVVGGVIRRIGRYDLVRIKPTESEAEHWFCLCLRRLWSSENCNVGVESRSGRIRNQWQCSIPGLAIGWFFRFCFRLRQPSFHLNVSDGVVNGIGRNGNVLILPTMIQLMTPLATLIFDFHYVVSSLLTPTTTPTPTPPLVKTSL